MKSRKLSHGQRTLAAATRFFTARTKRGAAWLRAKVANRLRVLRSKFTRAEQRGSA